ncbi:hypothetical protein B9Z55_026429 [Caenorhabditis nigoni]|uniref:Phlebovirus glycoprotein G2 fusion domain-containing protein n=1 Tax=Caenorhabditis nigoni TaxID=1611254 RepID=A0A2G5T2Q4_9PELO|nr:hypothetical protein B9Z55_026429 [Caenorhabditis nigoni]
MNYKIFRNLSTWYSDFLTLLEAAKCPAAKCPAAKCLAAKCPAAKCLAAKCLAAKCRGCEMSGCEMSGSQQSARATSDQLSVGDVVMVEDDGPQVNWPLARIDELGSRAAKLFVPRTGKTVERPFKKIYQLEVDKPRVEPKKPSVTTPIASTYTGPTTRARSRSLPGPLSSITLVAMVAMALLLPTASAFPMPNIDSSNPDSMFSQFAHLLAYGFLIIIVAVGLHVLLAIFQCSRQLFYIIQCVTFGWVSVVLWFCEKICGRRRSRSNSEVLLLLFMISLPQSIYMCNNIAHINAEEKACYEHINATQCHINSVSIINVRANGSTSCLEIQHVADKDSKPLLTLKITANALVSYCQKRTVYYSRDFRLTHEYLRRCDSAGSCSADKCGKIAHDEDIEEISQTAKSHPGYTNCAPGCGGWHCSCGWWDPSCLFYRYYALPTSNDIYEIFQCPVWSTRLRITVEIGPSKITTELVPGVKYDLPNRNISITATTIHTPPLQVHSATFISAFATGSNSSRWTSFTFTPLSAPGTPAKGFTGEMQCSTRKDAEDFNCQFDRSLCKCVGFSTLVNCQCRNEKMQDHRQTNQLPTKGIHHQVQKINAQVATLAVQDTVVSLHVEIRNATIARMTSVQACIAKQSGELDGCYSCLQGGYAPISCVSKKPMKAIVDCGTITTSFDCGPFGQSNQLQLPSNQPGVHLNCSIDCGTRTFLTIEGELAGLQAYDNNSTYYASPYQRVIESSLEFGNFVMDVFGKLTVWLRFPLFILGMAVALVSMPYLLRCFVSRKIQSKRQLILLQRSKYM